MSKATASPRPPSGPRRMWMPRPPVVGATPMGRSDSHPLVVSYEATVASLRRARDKEARLSTQRTVLGKQALWDKPPAVPGSFRFVAMWVCGACVCSPRKSPRAVVPCSSHCFLCFFSHQVSLTTTMATQRQLCTPRGVSSWHTPALRGLLQLLHGSWNLLLPLLCGSHARPVGAQQPPRLRIDPEQASGHSLHESERNIGRQRHYVLGHARMCGTDHSLPVFGPVRAVGSTHREPCQAAASASALARLHDGVARPHLLSHADHGNRPPLSHSSTNEGRSRSTGHDRNLSRPRRR